MDRIWDKKREEFRKRVLRTLEPVPSIKEILLAKDDLNTKRTRIRSALSDLLVNSYEETPDLPSLEWVLTHDAVEAWRNLCSRRNESLSGFSFLVYLDALINGRCPVNQPPPTSGFFAELDHLVRGISQRTGVYPDQVPAFLKHRGRKAAQLRSADLSRMAKTGRRHMERFSCGLDQEIIRRRGRNKKRILQRLGAADSDWGDWRWHCRHIIRDAETLSKLILLTDDEYRSVKAANESGIPFGITPFYLSLMDNRTDSPEDRAVRAQVIPSMQYVETMHRQRQKCDPSMDFMLEKDTSPIEGITRRYPNIVILKPVLTCPQICVYCQRNWQIEDVHSKTAAVSEKVVRRAIEWIAKNREINEVLITGGDPFLLSNNRIEQLLSRLSANPNIVRIRIGTRTPVTLPQRITDSLANLVARYHVPGKREMVIVSHFEHLYEITPEAVQAIQKFRRSGIDVYNQLVYTFFNSRKFEAAALRQKLRLIGVTPYYTFNTKGKEETDDFRVPIARLLQEQKEEARLLPGTVRTDTVVFNVPGLGKNYLDASQHHNVIAILPDGRRVYEFHPWEKKLTLVDTYVYTDVSIHTYLKRLKAAGENPRDYRSIWYYY
ncbi:MAG: KamA family radical SAM protein [Desulfobacteraceae bacterium]